MLNPVYILLLSIFYLTFWYVPSRGQEKGMVVLLSVCFLFREWKLSFSCSEQAPHVEYIYGMRCCCRLVPSNICSTYRHVFMLGCIIKINKWYMSCSQHASLFCHTNSQPCSCVQGNRYERNFSFEISKLSRVFPTRMVSKAERYIFKSLHSSFTEC